MGLKISSNNQKFLSQVVWQGSTVAVFAADATDSLRLLMRQFGLIAWQAIEKYRKAAIGNIMGLIKDKIKVSLA